MFQKPATVAILFLGFLLGLFLGFAQPMVTQDPLEKRIMELTKFDPQKDGTTERVAFRAGEPKNPFQVPYPLFTLNTILALDKKMEQ